MSIWVFCPFFDWVLLLLLFMCISCVFWKLSPCCLCHLQIFSLVGLMLLLSLFYMQGQKNKITFPSSKKKKKLLICVSVSLGPCNKVPQNRWLKTTSIYCLPVLEATRLKSRIGLPLQTLREAPNWLPPGIWWWLAILSIPWLVDTLHQSRSPCSRGYILPCISPLLIRTPSDWIKGPLESTMISS